MTDSTLVSMGTVSVEVSQEFPSVYLVAGLVLGSLELMTLGAGAISGRLVGIPVIRKCVGRRHANGKERESFWLTVSFISSWYFHSSGFLIPQKITC